MQASATHATPHGTAEAAQQDHAARKLDPEHLTLNYRPWHTFDQGWFGECPICHSTISCRKTPYSPRGSR